MGTQGILALTPVDEMVLSVVLGHLRLIPVESIVKAIEKANTAEAVGPILYPEAWSRKASNLHSANLDVLRRVEDLRRALTELDRLVAADPETAVPSIIL